jgi:hypothetical protein
MIIQTCALDVAPARSKVYRNKNSLLELRHWSCVRDDTLLAVSWVNCGQAYGPLGHVLLRLKNHNFHRIAEKSHRF